MEIVNIETLTDQGVGKLNEDALFTSGSRFGVFDGASSLDGYTDDKGYTGAYLASRIAKEVFEQSSGSLIETAVEVNQSIQSAMLKKEIDVSSKESLW